MLNRFQYGCSSIIARYGLQTGGRVPWRRGIQEVWSRALDTSEDCSNAAATHLQLLQGLGTIAKAVMAPPQLHSMYKALWGDLSCTLKACQSVLKGRQDTAPG